MRAIRKIAILGAALAAFGTIGVGTALADPPPGTVPGLTDIVAVGSATTSPLFSGSPADYSSGSLSYDYNHQSPTPTNKVYSWDAVDPTTGQSGGTIVTKGTSPTDTTCSITRPNGSNAGITALNRLEVDSNDPCIDFARSYRGPNVGTLDTFVPLDHDGIDWAYPVVSGQTSPQPASLTLAELKAVYLCQDTNWDQVGGANAPIVPVLPQAGSGVRSDFLLALGGVTPLTPGACVVNGTAANGFVIEENTGLSPGNTDQFTSTGAQDDIFPYSIGDWIGQSTPAVKGTGTAGTPGGATVGGHNSTIWGHGNLQLGLTVNDHLGVAESPIVTNSFSQPVFNQPNWEPQLTVTMYNVTANGCPNMGACLPTVPPYEAALSTFFRWLCTPVAQSDFVSYGFLPFCGFTTGPFLAGT